MMNIKDVYNINKNIRIIVQQEQLVDELLNNAYDYDTNDHNVMKTLSKNKRFWTFMNKIYLYI